MSFTAKFGADGKGKAADDVSSSEWSDDTSKALRDAGFKIVRFGAAPNTFLYVGQANSTNQPHGHGYLYFPNGDVQECDYKAGRASGPGTFVAVSGSELKGNWSENKRIGDFQCIDAAGLHWVERYGLDGKRTSRIRVQSDKPNPLYVEGGDAAVPKTIVEYPPADEPARTCWNCNGKFRDRNNHAWACRTHKGRWTEDLAFRGDGPRPGVWSCCGREAKFETGCTFAGHNLQ